MENINPCLRPHYATKEVQILPTNEIIIKHGITIEINTLKREQFLASFISCILATIDRKTIKNDMPLNIVFGTSGGYYSKKASQIVLQVCAANNIQNILNGKWTKSDVHTQSEAHFHKYSNYKVFRIYTGRYGILPLPAVSLLVKSRKDIFMGFYLGYADYRGEPVNIYYNIKCLMEDGRLMTNEFRAKANENFKIIRNFKTVPELLSSFELSTTFTVDGYIVNLEIINPVTDYMLHSKQIFNYDKIRNLLRKDKHKECLKILIDCKNGGTGSIIKYIFTKEFGLSEYNIFNSEPTFDEPPKSRNLETRNCWNVVEELTQKNADLGVTFSADGSSCLLFGFWGLPIDVTEAIAIICTHLHCIPYFQDNLGKAIGRAYTTNLPLRKSKYGTISEIHELIPANKTICERLATKSIDLYADAVYGVMSNSLRVPDGIWMLLAWLTIVEHQRKSVKDIVLQNRIYCKQICEARLYYEELNEVNTNKFVNHLVKLFRNEPRKVQLMLRLKLYPYELIHCEFIGFIDNDMAPRIIFSDGSRIAYRILERRKNMFEVIIYVTVCKRWEEELCEKKQCIRLSCLCEVAMRLAKMKHFFGLPSYKSFH